MFHLANVCLRKEGERRPRGEGGRRRGRERGREGAEEREERGEGAGERIWKEIRTS